MTIRVLRLLTYLRKKLRLPNDPESIRLSTERIRDSAEIAGVNLWVLVIAIFIACLGLNSDSVTVVIGAMLISPLMGPISALGLGLGINDWELIKKALRNLIVAALLSLITSTLFFIISPMKDAGQMLLSQTSPSMYDVLIAFFGGLASIMASSSKLRASNVIPGVAIATTLMMPLCTAGYGISIGEWRYIIGAIYMFFINSVFIGAATFLMVNLFGYPKVNINDSKKRKHTRVVIASLLIITFIPSVYLTYHIVTRYFFEKNANAFIKNEVQDKDHFVITKRLLYNRNKPVIELSMLGLNIDSVQYKDLVKRMPGYFLGHVSLILFQGEDTRTAAKSYFEQISSGLEMNNAAIQNLYRRVDSLQKITSHQHHIDSMEFKIAGLVHAVDTSVQTVRVSSLITYNIGTGKKDTSWTAQLQFPQNPAPADRIKMNELVREKLRLQNLQLRFD
jgi:uncharacterized hydrophobic protein (TIGR00271 family)